MSSRFDGRTIQEAFGNFVSGNSEEGDTIYFQTELLPNKPKVKVLCNSREFGRREEDLTHLLPNSPNWKVDRDHGEGEPDRGFPNWTTFLEALFRELKGIANIGGRELVEEKVNVT